MGWPAALGAGGGLCIGGPGGGILGEVLFQEEGSEFAGEGAGALLTLGEGDGWLGLLGIEVEVEDGLGLLEPALAKAFTIGRVQSCSRVHGRDQGEGREAKATLIILARWRSCNYGMDPQAIEGQGIVKGELRASRRTVLLRGTQEFGTPPAEVAAAIESINDLERLEYLLLHVRDVKSWHELLQ